MYYTTNVIRLLFIVLNVKTHYKIIDNFAVDDSHAMIFLYKEF